MGKDVKSTVIFSKTDGPDIGLSIELLDSKSKHWILDGWSLDGFLSTKNFGAGVAKDIYKKGIFEIDAGIYVHQNTYNALRGKFAPEVSAGVSIGMKF